MPRGQNPEFLEQQGRFAPASDVAGELAKIPLSVKFPVEVDRQIREIPGYSAKVRRWVMEGMQRESGESQSVAVVQSFNLEGKLPSSVQIQSVVDRVLLTMPPKERKLAAKYFKKLVKELQDS
jgi:hypothetical protein